MIDLGTLAPDLKPWKGHPDSRAEAINDRGQIVGRGDIVNNKTGYVESHGFLWENGRMTDLGSAALSAAYPAVINDRGQIPGSVDGGRHGVSKAALWEQGAISGRVGSTPTSGMTRVAVGTRARTLSALLAAGRSLGSPDETRTKPHGGRATPGNTPRPRRPRRP